MIAAAILRHLHAIITTGQAWNYPHFLQSTGFVLAPDSTILTAVYSSGAIGRLVAEDVAGLVDFVKSQH